MATLQANNYYLDIDGTNLSSYVISVTLSPTVAEQVTTAGSSTTHVTRGAGLYDHSISFQLRASDSGEYSLALLKGSHLVTYGPNGNATGKPKHSQTFILNAMPHTVNVEKPMVMFDVSGNAAASPATDMMAGGVWA